MSAAASDARARAGSASLERALRRLDAALALHAPERHATLRKDARLDRLAERVAIPSELRALWRWADGAAGLVTLPERRSEAGARRDARASARPRRSRMDLLSVREAERAILFIREAEEDERVARTREMVPFAAEPSSSEHLVVDDEGRVLLWRREDPAALEEVAASLADLLDEAARAIVGERE